MLYRTIEIEKMFTLKEAEHEIIEIMDNNGSQFKVVSIKKNSGFHSHKFNTNAGIYMLKGEIELSFPKEIVCGCDICGTTMPENHDKEKSGYKIKKGQLFLFEKDVNHSLTAIKNSIFLLIKI